RLAPAGQLLHGDRRGADPAAGRDECVIAERIEIDQLDGAAAGERGLDLHEGRVRIATATGSQEGAATRQVGDVGFIQQLALVSGWRAHAAFTARSPTTLARICTVLPGR